MAKQLSDESSYTLYPIIMNGDNLVTSQFNNTYRYNFPQGAVMFKNSKISLSNVNIYYSWYNISSALNNNVFQIVQPTLAGSTTLTITIPDGNYDIPAINAYMQSVLVANNLYLLDGSGNNVYYIEIVANPTTYKIDLNTYAVPIALPGGYTNPAGMTFPAVQTTTQFIIPATNIRNILGVNAATYPNPAAAVDTTNSSTFTPQVSVVQSLIMTCSLVNNRLANPSTVLYAFTPAGVSFGDVVVVNPNEYSFIDVQDGNYPSFDITFLDQDFNAVSIRDTNLVIQLLIKVYHTGVSY